MQSFWCILSTCRCFYSDVQGKMRRTALQAHCCNNTLTCGTKFAGVFSKLWANSEKQILLFLHLVVLQGTTFPHQCECILTCSSFPILQASFLHKAANGDYNRSSAKTNSIRLARFTFSQFHHCNGKDNDTA